MQNFVLRLALILSLIFTLSSCAEKTSYVVAHQSAGGEIQLSDITKVKHYFKRVLENAKIQDELSNFEIVSIPNDTGKALQLLRAHAGAKNVYIAIEVFDGEKGEIGITSASLTQGVLICNTSCTEGCLPVKSKGQWSCSNPCNQGSGCQEIITKAYEENNYTTPIQAFLEKY